MSAQEKPNVIFILTDDQGWWDVGINGNPHIETPVMDSIAKEGVRFTRFYAAPVCTPTRAGLMTGRTFQRTGAIDTYMGRDTMSADEVTIAQLFQRQGYRTANVGKWHLGRYMKYHPTHRGFDEFFGFWQYGFINRYFDSDELFHNKEPVVTTGYVTDVLTDEAMAFVRRNRDKPFFLYLTYNAPHDPHFAPDAYVDRYLKVGAGVPASPLPYRDARIYGMITCIDDNVGRLLKAVDDAGLREKTVVFFMGDNGGVSSFFRCGLRGNKGNVYEGGVRVPFFVRWTNHFPAGATVDAMAHNLDVFPTLCELTGAPLPNDRKIDGKSILPLIKNGGGESPYEYLFQQWTRVRPKPDENWTARDKRYKLVNGELFDLQTDPGEKHNVADQHPDIARRLRAEFEKWFADVTARQDYARVPIEVGRDDENPVEIDITWGEPVGKKVKPTYRRYIRDTVDDWSEVGDVVRWKIEVVQTGRYEVVLSYGCNPEDAGSKFRVSVGSAHLDGVVEATPNRFVFRPRTIGAMELPQGPATLEIKPLSIVGKELMALHKVWLRRLP